MRLCGKVTQKIGFLPEEGVLCVDQGVLDLIRNPAGSLMEVYRARNARLKNSLKFFRRRRDLVLTTPEMWGEIESNLRYFKEKYLDSKRNGSSNREFNYRREVVGIDISSKDYRKVFKDLWRNWRKMYDFFKMGGSNGREDNFYLERRDVEGFVLEQRDLSVADRSLVIEALRRGNGIGVYSSDNPLLGAYVQGVREFRLEGCFVCDGNRSETREI